MCNLKSNMQIKSTNVSKGLLLRSIKPFRMHKNYLLTLYLYKVYKFQVRIIYAYINATIGKSFLFLIFCQTQPILTWRMEYANGKNDHILFWCHSIKDWISFWVHLLDHERNGQTGKSTKRASASWVICQFEHCVHDPINAPRMKFNPYIYIL